MGGLASRGKPARRGPTLLCATGPFYMQPLGAALEAIGKAGFTAAEIMVTSETASQDPKALHALAEDLGVAVGAIHAPFLLLTRRVFTTDPLEKIKRSVELAQEVGTPLVVVHPAFRWQVGYARWLRGTLAGFSAREATTIAVENMFPVRRGLGTRSMEMTAFRPSIDPTDVGHRNYTLDLSHTSAAHMDAMKLAERMGDGLTHVHLADGSGLSKDEHMVPGRGDQPCAELCESLAANGFKGQVVLEISTRRARGPAERAKDLAEALLFARLHLISPDRRQT